MTYLCRHINFDGDKMVTLARVSSFIQSLNTFYNLLIDLLLSLSDSLRGKYVENDCKTIIEKIGIFENRDHNRLFKAHLSCDNATANGHFTGNRIRFLVTLFKDHH